MAKKAKRGKRTLPTQEKAVALPLNDTEKELISEYEKKVKSNYVSFTTEQNEKGESNYKIESPRGSYDDKLSLLRAAICKATGATDPNFATNIYSSCMLALTKNPSDLKQTADKLNEVLIALNALQPGDEIEAMLISKLIVLHFQSMEFFKRTIYEEQTCNGVDLNINRSTKLTRLYNETLETLMRYRRKGEQKVIVQHVQVNEGGKAVVGGVFEEGGSQ